MKTVHWLFAVGAALFLCGVSFAVAGARALRAAPAPARDAAQVTPVASVKQIMKGIVRPAAATVFDAVSTTVTAKGVEEKAPQSEEEWEAVGNAAAALIESGNLLLMGRRVVDTGDWIRMSRAMIEAGQVALKAVEARNADALLASGEGV